MDSLVTGLLIDPQLCRIEKVQVSRDRTKWSALLGYKTLDRGEFDDHTDLWCADYPNSEWPGFRFKNKGIPLPPFIDLYLFTVARGQQTTRVSEEGFGFLQWAKNRPVGYVCRHCHEPVEVYFSQREADGPIHHVRFLCGCTMLLMSPEMGPWWREYNCAEIGTALSSRAQNWRIRYMALSNLVRRGFSRPRRGFLTERMECRG
jgi:hypothetical protein